MDKPLKYFLGVSAVFLLFIAIFAIGSFTRKPSIPKDYVVMDEEDTRMFQAKELARNTLDTFFRLYPQHADSAFVRFSFEPTRDHVEHLWGKVMALDSARVKILLKRKEGLEDIYYPDNLELTTSRIEDWMIHPGDGTIRGGFTAQAILMKEREKPSANLDSLKRQLEKFRDAIQ